MDRTEAMARQSQGERVDVFEEPCTCCGRNSWYVRGLDRYLHVDGSSNAACWLRLSQGLPPVVVVAQRESYDSARDRVA